MLMPICESLNEIFETGTRNDAWDLVEGFTRECKRLITVQVATEALRHKE